MKSVKDLKVYKNAFQLVLDIYKLTELFPKSEMFGLVNQIRRAAISINSNLAEGSKRNTTGEYKHFIGISRGSASELEFQLEVSNKLGFIDDEQYTRVSQSLDEICRMLSGLINSLGNCNTNHSHSHWVNGAKRHESSIFL